jgi:hypothetical protein
MMCLSFAPLPFLFPFVQAAKLVDRSATEIAWPHPTLRRRNKNPLVLTGRDVADSDFLA